MFEVELSLADLIKAVQDSSDNEAQVMAALIHILLGEDAEIAQGA
jgi:hypothetical protein